MGIGLLQNVEQQGTLKVAVPAGPKAEIPASEQPPYLARLATLPDRAEAAPQQSALKSADGPDAARLNQIEHALTIVASVVARLAKEAQQSRLNLRATECDPNLQEDRRAQRELLRSMQARLAWLEERIERQSAERLSTPPITPPEVVEQLSASLISIRNSLSALAKRRLKTPTSPT